MRLSILIVVVAALLSGPAWADEISDQIEEAKKLYQGGQYNEAIKELGFAINEIHAKLSGRFAESMPPAPEGWKAEEVKSRSMGMMGGGQMVSRRYRSENGQTTMNAVLVVDSPIIRRIAIMLNKPMMLRSHSVGRREFKRVRIKGEHALLKWEPPRRSGELSMVLGGGHLMVQVKGEQVEDQDALIRFMESWDFEAAKRIAGL